MSLACLFFCLTAALVLFITGCGAVRCYNCDVDLDTENQVTFGEKGCADPVDPDVDTTQCEGQCLKTWIRRQSGLQQLSRYCVNTCVEFSGVNSVNTCCATDLCNHTAYVTTSWALILASVCVAVNILV